MQTPLSRAVGVRGDDQHRDYGEEAWYRHDEADFKITQAIKAAHNLRQPKAEEHKQAQLPHDSTGERSTDAEAMMLDTLAPFDRQALHEPPALFRLQPCRAFRPIRQVT